MSRRLLVLGGTSGIGAATFNLLSQSSQFDRAQAYGYENFDVAYRAPLREVIVGLRPTDIVYSAGVNVLNWLKDVGTQDFQTVMMTNVYGFMNLIRVLDEERVGPCNIVAVTSDAAWRPMRTSAVYCASKAALEMTVRVASREYASAGWRVNAVAPGKVEDTAMTEYVDRKVLQLRGWSVEAAEAYELQSTPLGRKVQKDEVAVVIAQVLFGPAAQTGEIVAVNGGR
jgi:NAD(P)-dependent dehydrogenase (short-subunit alcohol dehydrogenase family)